MTCGNETLAGHRGYEEIGEGHEGREREITIPPLITTVVVMSATNTSVFLLSDIIHLSIEKDNLRTRSCDKIPQHWTTVLVAVLRLIFTVMYHTIIYNYIMSIAHFVNFIQKMHQSTQGSWCHI